MIIRVKGINKVRSRGRIYYYHRKSGVRLSSPYGTLAFAMEVARLDAMKADDRLARKVLGSLGALVAAYRSSPEFARLAERTKTDYDRVFNYLGAMDGLPLAVIDEAAVLKIRDRAFEQHRRRFANYVLQVLSLLLAWGKPRKFVAANFAAGIEKIAAPKGAPKANRPWSDTERRIVLDESKGGLRVGIALGMFAAMRLGDVVRFTWAGYDGTAIEWRQGKTGEPIWLPAHRQLREFLDAAPRTAITVVTSAAGLPRKQSGFAKSFGELIKRLEAQGRVGPGLTFHGLRHTAGKILGDAGVDARTIAVLLGQKSISMAIHYSEGADRKRRAVAAIETLERTANGKSAKLPDGFAK
jgi:integrase